MTNNALSDLLAEPKKGSFRLFASFKKNNVLFLLIIYL